MKMKIGIAKNSLSADYESPLVVCVSVVFVVFKVAELVSFRLFRFWGERILKIVTGLGVSKPNSASKNTLIGSNCGARKNHFEISKFVIFGL